MLVSDQGGRAGGYATLSNGAGHANGAAILTETWPPAYVAVPPLHLDSSPGFTLTAWVYFQAAGPVWTLGSSGPAWQPDDWASARAEYLRVDANAQSLVLRWASTAQGEAVTQACSQFAPAKGWVFIGISVATLPSGGGVRWSAAQGTHPCSGTVVGSAPPARWWMPVTLGGGSFVGAISSATALDDVALGPQALAALGAGSTDSCGPRPSPSTTWTPGAAVQTAWASTLGSGCMDPLTGLPIACLASSVVNGWPAMGGCGLNGIITAGGADAYPSVTLDLGTSALVSSVRMHAWAGAPPAYASYAILVGDVRPPAAGEPQLMPFYYPNGLANAACVVQDPSRTSQPALVADFQCGGWGRYVTLQMLASDAGDGVLRLCQLQAYVNATATTAPPSPARTPSRAGTYAAAAGMTHRYVAGGARASGFGNAVLDLVGNDDGAGSGTHLLTDGELAFDGQQPCVSFASPHVSSTTGNFSLLVRFIAPATEQQHAQTVLWESADARLYLQPNASGTSLAFDAGGSTFSGPQVGAAQKLAVAVTCALGMCTIVS